MNRDNFNLDAKDDIKSRIDISDLVGRYVKLVPDGATMKGLCPFHKEKTPSFKVNPSKGIYHCFGCGKGGDIFSFLMDIEGLSFRESIERLAEETGVELNYSRKQDEKTTGTITKNRAVEIHKMAVEYYYAEMKKSPKTVEYLKNRGLSAETVRDFKIGFAPEGWQNLIKHLSSLGIKENELVECGLALSSASGGRIYDRFRDRIIFPIFDISSKPIGFGGRAFEKDAKPKYLNSPQTILYKKERVLFGLDKARNSIKEENYAIFVEGYMDVISLYQHGVRNVVATSGTALTNEHAKVIKRFTSKLILLFDGDNAGYNAAEKALFLLSPYSFEIYVAILPEGEDPDTFIGQNGYDNFMLFLKHAEYSTDFLLSVAKKKIGFETAESKSRVVSYLMDYVSALDGLVRHETIRKVADELALPVDIVNKCMKDKSNSLNSQENTGNLKERIIKYLNTEEGSFLHILIQYPGILEKIKSNIDTEIFTNSFTKNLYSLMLEEYKDSGTLSNLISRIKDKNIKSLLSTMFVTQLVEIDAEAEALRKIKRFIFRKEKNKMALITSELRKETNPEKKKELLFEQKRLAERLGDLKKDAWK